MLCTCITALSYVYHVCVIMSLVLYTLAISFQQGTLMNDLE